MRNTLRTLSAAALVSTLTAVGCKSSARDPGGIPGDAKIEQTVAPTPGAGMHIAAGDLAAGQGNKAEAIRQYEKAVSLDPTGKLGLYKLAALHTSAGDFDLAIPLWQKYVDATNQSANAYVNLARANELASRWREAEVAYLRAINREPTNRAAHVNYGILLAKRDRIDEAQAQFAAVLKPAEVQYNLGSVYELRRQFELASTHYNKALAFDPNFTPARQRLATMRGVSAAD